jgi:protein-tyrosine-phosphatase
MSITSSNSDKPSVLFVCTANLCRSPMAAALFGEMVAQDPAAPSGWRIASAGTWAVPNLPAPEMVVQVMALHGLDIKAHRSSMLDAALLEKYALILTMEKGHKEALRFEFPDQAQKVFLLSEMAGITSSIADPMGGSLQAFEQAVGTIKGLLEEGKQRIYSLALK